MTEIPFFPLRRSIINHRYIEDAEKFRFWVWLLLKATHIKRKQLVGNQTVELEVGQLIFGREKAAKELKITERKVRTLLKFFVEKEQKVTSKVTSKFTVLTIVKYSTYLFVKNQSDQQSDQQVTSKWPASDQQVTTNNNKDNKDNVNKEIKSSCKLPDKKPPKKTTLKNLTDEDYQTILDSSEKLQDLAEKTAWTIDGIKFAVQRIKDHCLNSDKKYKNIPAVIRTWDLKAQYQTSKPKQDRVIKCFN